MHSDAPTKSRSWAQSASTRSGAGRAPTPSCIREPRSFLLALPRGPYSRCMRVAAQLSPAAVELTVLMPCLDEAKTVATCVRKALEACAAAGVQAEILVADQI